MTKIVALEVNDPGAQGEYGPLGKVIFRSNVRSMTPEEIESEKRLLRSWHGEHVSIVEVEEIPAVERWSIMTEDGLTMWREDLFTQEEAEAFVRKHPLTQDGTPQVAAPESVIRAAQIEWKRIQDEHERAKKEERLAAVERLLKAKS